MVSPPGGGNGGSQFQIDGCWQELHTHLISLEVHLVLLFEDFYINTVSFPGTNCRCQARA